MKFRTVLFLPALLLLIFGCDSFYTIPLSKESDTLRVKLECGTVDITLHNWQGHVFDFYQEFDVKGDVVLKSDSLFIRYKGQELECHFVGEDTAATQLVISGKRTVRTAFIIKQDVNIGDTIFVRPSGYLNCNNIDIEIKELKLVMDQNLRAPFNR